MRESVVRAFSSWTRHIATRGCCMHPLPCAARRFRIPPTHKTLAASLAGSVALQNAVRVRAGTASQLSLGHSGGPLSHIIAAKAYAGRKRPIRDSSNSETDHRKTRPQTVGLNSKVRLPPQKIVGTHTVLATAIILPDRSVFRGVTGKDGASGAPTARAPPPPITVNQTSIPMSKIPRQPYDGGEFASALCP